jgi:YbgC/YbaW family acyl-CoA thioester hydrolase
MHAVTRRSAEVIERHSKHDFRQQPLSAAITKPGNVEMLNQHSPDGAPIATLEIIRRYDRNRGAPRIRTEVQVMFFDTDCGGVVHNIAYLRFIEIARTLLAEQLGLALSEMATTQKYPVVVRTEIDYRRAAKLGDRLTIEGWLDQLERVRFWCAFRIVRDPDGTLIAECRQTLALIQMPSAKLLRLPDSWDRYRAAAVDAH